MAAFMNSEESVYGLSDKWDIRVEMALESDAEEVWRLLRELAAYEDKLDSFHLTVGQLRVFVWGPRSVAGAFLARVEGRPVGVALYCLTFPSFSGQPSLFVEDLFVREEYRRHGVGRALLQACAQEAVEQDCASLRWWALDWNKQAMGFYQQVGGHPIDRCVVHSLDVTGGADAAR